MDINTKSKELHKINHGFILSSDLKIPIHFGLVYDDEGVIKLDLFVEESYKLSTLSRDKIDELLNLSFNAEFITTENNELEFFHLNISTIKSSWSNISMICYDRMVYRKPLIESIEPTILKPTLFFLELEGLQMYFCEITDKSETRDGEKIIGIMNWERDFTKAILKYKDKQYKLVFSKSKVNENIVVEFIHDSKDTLQHEDFLDFKLEFIYLIALLNGAEVKVKREFIGQYYSEGKLDSQIVITYSFKKINNIRYNDYFPLNDPINISINVLNIALSTCFENYCKWNNSLSLNSIVFYLNNSEQTKSIEERFFIQIIAFERLTSLYVEYLGLKEDFIPKKEDFLVIKNDLLNVLEKHKKSFGSNYNSAKSKICNLNQIKSVSTVEKMYRIINDLSIPIDENLKKLIEIVRHKSIHKGEIGEGKDRITNFYLLDRLLRRILAQLIGYKNMQKKLVDKIK